MNESKNTSNKNKDWDSVAYAKFLDLRTLPATNLLSSIPLNFKPKKIYDLGCGTGNSTSILKNKWLDADVIGIDSSDTMLEKACSTYKNIKFIKENIEDLSVTEKADLIFSNAALQWLGSHETLFKQLAAHLKKDGMLAVQMPNNFHSPTHQITINILQETKEWSGLLKNLRHGELKHPFYSPLKYYDILTNANLFDIRIWETNYIQELDNHEEIFNFVKSTGMRPILNNLNEEDCLKFKNIYIEKTKKLYPIQKNGKVLLPFNRLFMTGTKI